MDQQARDRVAVWVDAHFDAYEGKGQELAEIMALVEEYGTVQFWHGQTVADRHEPRERRMARIADLRSQIEQRLRQVLDSRA